MKILRIQFENLNSLPSGDIDFTASPLAEAGLFAITGPTGAGKSTILDAITLALYGQAARYQNRPNPEDVMSRRAGSCGAEVTFEVRGKRYRARWHLRRARNRPDGNIQPAQRHLYDEEGTVLAQKLTEVNQRVEELTGLDAKRFLRSVMLPQGEFAEFLKAKAATRAELLESLTGTEIYGELGRLAHQEATQKEEALTRRADLLGATTLWTPEERAERAATLSQQAEKITEFKTTLAAARVRLQQGQQLIALHERESALATEAEALECRLREATPERERWEFHQAGVAFFPALQALDHLETEINALEQALQLTIPATQEAEQTALAAQAALSAIFQREAKSEAGLLAQIEAAATLREERLGSIAKALEAEPVDLEATLPNVLERLTQIVHLRETAAQQAKALAALEAELRDFDTKAPALKKALSEAEAVVAQKKIEAQASAQKAAELREGRTEAQLQERSRKLEERMGRLQELAAMMERNAEFQQRSTQKADTEGVLKDEITEMEQRLRETTREVEMQEQLLNEAKLSLERLLKVAGYEVQRSELTPGEPCPLCGSQEHPLAGSAVLDAEIEDARRRVAAAKGGCETTQKEKELAHRDLEQRKAALTELRRANALLRTEQMENYDRLTALARPLRVYTLESVEEKRGELRAEREAWDQRLLAIREADQLKSAADLALAEATRPLEAAAHQLSARQQAQEELCARVALLLQERGASESRLSEQATALTGALAPLATPLPDPGHEAALRKALEARLQSYRALRDERAELKRLAAEAEGVRKVSETRRGRLLEEAERLALPAGTTADPNRADRLMAEWKTAEVGRTALERLRTEAVSLASRSREQAQRLEGMRQRRAAEDKALQAALAPSRFESINALREAQLTPDEAQSISRRLEALAAERQEQAGRRELLRSQIAQLREADTPQGEALSATAQEVERLEKELFALTEERASLDRDCRDHDERAARHRVELAALQRDREGAAGWLQMKAMIGGPAFKKFAQGLTLDLLLRHANLHLGRLTDRYRLQRKDAGDLELEITDLHQAGALRPAESLSGGESFLASLALALGLADLAGRNVRIDSLFIDEGFGSLDPDTLDVALAALDTLRLSQKMVGVISHVDLLKERIPVQIVVEKLAGGESRLYLRG